MRIPPFLAIPAALTVVGVLLPLCYLVMRAFSAEPDALRDIVFRPRNALLAANTLLLTLSVLGVTTLVAFPLSFLVTRTNFRGNWLVGLIGVLPLALPSYVAAYAYIAAAGGGGAVSSLLGFSLPMPSGFWGSLLILSAFTFPYLFLNFRSALLQTDPTIEEAARVLGKSSFQILYSVLLPTLRPAWLAGGLLIALHVLGDFAVVSLMRYPTFSAAIYQQYSAAYDRVYSAWLALLLLGMTGAALWAEWRLMRGVFVSRVSIGSARKQRILKLSLLWEGLSWIFVGLISTVTFIIPVGTIIYWLGGNIDWDAILKSSRSVIGVAVVTSIIATLLAFCLAYIGSRYNKGKNSFIAKLTERIAYLGYATPPLAFALALVFFSLQLVPSLYQTVTLLVIAYILHFVAEAIGPLRSGFALATVRLEEAARVLGKSAPSTFLTVTLPLLRPAILSSAAFIFLSTLKELPLTLLLSPPNFETLARNVWSYTEEAQYREAAPYALVLVSIGIVTGILLMQKARKSS